MVNNILWVPNCVATVVTVVGDRTGHIDARLFRAACMAHWIWL